MGTTDLLNPRSGEKLAIMIKKKSVIITLAALSAVSLIVALSTAPPQIRTAESNQLPENFSSTTWKEAAKTNFGLRQKMAHPLCAWIIGKTDADVVRLLGQPEWTGVGGVPGLTWQPGDGSIAWNYSLVSASETSHLSDALRLHVKNGHVIAAKIVTIGS